MVRALGLIVIVIENATPHIYVISQSEVIVMLVFACLYVCVCIATRIYMEVAGYDTCIVEKYHGNRSKVKISSEIVKKKT